MFRGGGIYKYNSMLCFFDHCILKVILFKLIITMFGSKKLSPIFRKLNFFVFYFFSFVFNDFLNILLKFLYFLDTPNLNTLKKYNICDFFKKIHQIQKL